MNVAVVPDFSKENPELSPVELGPAIVTPQPGDLEAQVLAAGVKDPVALAPIAQNSPAIIQTQFAWTTVRLATATLVQSIRGNWSPPSKYLQWVSQENGEQREARR